jgi:hypothetical protein
MESSAMRGTIEYEMKWNTELAYFITPKSGPMRPMATLLDANRAILDEVPAEDRTQAHWVRAKRAILRAAETAADHDVRTATDALMNALIAEGWMNRRR